MLNELLSSASSSQLTWKGIVVDIVIIKVDLKGIVGYNIIYFYISIFFQVNPELQSQSWWLDYSLIGAEVSGWV